MLQQDLLDTLFLNRKALADVGRSDTQSGANENTPTTTTTTKTTTTSSLTMKDASGTGAASADVCPVDHKSREAWLKQAQAAAAHDALPPSQPSQQQQQQPPSAEDACPVDHKSREAWLKQAQRAAAHDAQQSPQLPSTPSTPQQNNPTSSAGWGWRIPFFSSPSSSTQSASAATTKSTITPQSSSNEAPTNTLGKDREVSTIPRSTAPGALLDTARPSNHETETGADASTGNWVYPSEKMFFDAMKRKGHDTRAADMKTVVPIHNAVNERAWVEIKAWERPYQGHVCPDGPRLDSFTGLSSKMSPKARLNTLLGYTPPFDRHDWVVDRCGTKVEYVIDFYTGKIDKGGRPSFYLDVRPKLNTWEGARMRASRILGLV